MTNVTPFRTPGNPSLVAGKLAGGALFRVTGLFSQLIRGRLGIALLRARAHKTTAHDAQRRAPRLVMDNMSATFDCRHWPGCPCLRPLGDPQ